MGDDHPSKEETRDAPGALRRPPRLRAPKGADTMSAYETVGRESMLGIRLHDVLPAALALPRLTLDDAAEGEAPDFASKEVLGEGGMGRVELARQMALGRDVAVKFLLDSRRSPDDVATLLREARLTGRLEHPNIIPVHWIGYCEDVGPVVVMKRVRGRTWAQALRDLDRDDEAALSSHIEILLRVCDAIDYAHAQGVVHRDIKPANVMLGDFGEVYVLDWGIAVEIDTWEPDGKVTGTPAYMAPEMVDPSTRPVDRRSDVYLLGATLFEVLFGRPPHGRENAIQALLAATHPLEGPETHAVDLLASICRRATALDPDARFQSVAELRAALRQYFQHRNAAHLAHTADEDLRRVQAALDAPDPDHAALLERLNVAKYQMQTALGLWPESPTARRGLEALVAPTLACHLALGNLQAARQLADATGERVDAAQVARLEALEQGRALEGRAMQRVLAVRRERSLEVGSRMRSAILLAFGAALAVLAALPYVVRGGGSSIGAPHFLLELGLGAGALWLVILLVARRRRETTYVDRTSTLAITVCVVLVCAHRALALRAGYEPLHIVQGDLLLLCGPLLMLGTLHRGFYLVGGLGLVGAVLSVVVPETSRALMNIVPLLLVLAVYDLWRRGSSHELGLAEGAVEPSAAEPPDGAA